MSLQSRLKDLSGSLGQTHQLVDRLRNFTTSVGQGDQARVELGTEIHARLKEAEEEMELLRDEADALETGTEHRRKGMDNEKEAERERVVSLVGKLGMDLKRFVSCSLDWVSCLGLRLYRTRGDFRNAQLQAKKNAEVARRKEREVLFSRSQTENQKRPAEKLTQGDIEMNAAGDVTAALRRTHQLMQAELSKSQFAQQTLGRSSFLSVMRANV